ncbi:phytanoyl-CoA dioxygenase [Xylona heveae TC161]|uniref:Phytanoyl-CoA dioxygenase n=1 Tax=Xylona heveae (strain CBS 132557 / TC161) TaxID=1328760 RepID=A0A165IJ67_XYLHT|nr:phytanoyl-CoA dioxygenase [Xylona heveae TC161]KZF24970.1 phytanoyl-CoA dioxygenase [Xylona heveae TC161]
MPETFLAPAAPAPIDPSYRPKKSIITAPATAPVEYILSIIARDGGVILKDLVSAEELASIDQELRPWSDRQRRHADETAKLNGDAFYTIPRQTVLVPGLVGKSDTIASICEHPVLEQLRQHILQDKFNVYREDWADPNTINPLLSLSVSMNIGYGAPRQRLHRDDNVHGIRHPKPEDWSFKHASQFGCLIAGCDVTRENGATMFVPGSHKWDDQRWATPQEDDVCFAEMSAGSALIFLASAFHGGGHNSVPNSVRTMHSLFFVRGTLRTEENQFLAIPRSKVMKMSPKMLELLGYTKPTSALGIVENISPHEDLEGIWAKVMQ